MACWIPARLLRFRRGAGPLFILPGLGMLLTAG